MYLKIRPNFVSRRSLLRPGPVVNLPIVNCATKGRKIAMSILGAYLLGKPLVYNSRFKVMFTLGTGH